MLKSNFCGSAFDFSIPKSNVVKVLFCVIAFLASDSKFWGGYA
jgi:hypothetical protein